MILRGVGRALGSRRYWAHTWKRNLLSPWSTGLPEKLTVTSAIQKIPCIFHTRKFITAFTTASHLFLSWARSIQSIPLNSLLEDQFSYYPASKVWTFQVDFFPQVFPPKICMYLSSPPYVLHALPISEISCHEQYCRSDILSRLEDKERKLCYVLKRGHHLYRVWTVRRKWEKQKGLGSIGCLMGQRGGLLRVLICSAMGNCLIESALTCPPMRKNLSSTCDQ